MNFWTWNLDVRVSLTQVLTVLPGLCRVSTVLALSLRVAAPLWVFTPGLAENREPARAQQGMVVSVNRMASEAGVDLLKAGGNAVDAAVGVGFVLAVVHPAAGNLGGGGFMTIHFSRDRSETTLDYRETAPARAHSRMYLDDQGEIREGLSTRGHLASGVPGSVAGLYLAWSRYGSLPWHRVMQPAIDLARQGFSLTESQASSIRDAAELLSANPESARLFLKDGDFYETGERLIQTDLATTLDLLAEQGPEVFYRGRIAHLIVAEMRRGGGLISLEDLNEYRAKWRPPVRGDYRGLEIVSMGPPSSGGIVLIQMLNMMERYPLRSLEFGSTKEIHLKVEVMRRAFADRAFYLGDPDFVEIPVPRMLSKVYAGQRSANIRLDRASDSDLTGHGTLAKESDSTTHYSVMDRWGNAVAATTTINGGYGSGVTVAGAGFLLNNEMDDFTSRPGTPNMFGLIQSEKNSIQPFKRPLSAMTPTIVKKNGRPYLVIGSPGGPKIINTVFQVILNVVDHGFHIQEAVDAPRIHHQWKPDELVAEPGVLLGDGWVRLRDMGHRLRLLESLGDAHCIMVDPRDSWLLGAADPRSDGFAAGY